MNCVILQPSYIPWRGYFHQMQKADVFVFYDDVQYDKRGWRNRNRIKTQFGSQWLTIPVFTKGTRSEAKPVREVSIDWSRTWSQKQWDTIRHSYHKAPYFTRYEALLASFFAKRPELLADFTIETTIALAKELGIKGTRYVRSSTLPAKGEKTDRLVSLLNYLGASHYISGPSAQDYLEEEKLRAAGISLEYMVYNYPEYPQLYPPFDSQVSIIDLLVMTGPEATQYIWGSRPAVPAGAPSP